MRSILSVGVVLALLGAPAWADAQEPPRTRTEQAKPDHGHDQPAVGFLLRHRAALQLSDAQITSLRGIAQRLEEQNRPLQQQLRDAGIPVGREGHERRRQMTPQQRAELKQRLEAHKPVLMQLRQNAQSAMREARAVLTPEQQQRMREIMRAHRDRQGQRQDHGRPDAVLPGGDR